MATQTMMFGEETAMTEAEYLASDFKIDPDFVNGHLEERFVGDIEHANWQRALLLWFHANTNLLAASEIHVRFPDGNYRIPDVAVFLKPPQGAYVTEPPLAVIEILSPSDTFRRLKERMRDYERMGVKNLLVVENRTDVSRFRDDNFTPVSTGRSPLEGTNVSIEWKGAASLLWPNEAVQ